MSENSTVAILVEALERLERANDAVAAATTRERYVTDLCDVQDALFDLDNARRRAREVLRDYSKAGAVA